MESALFKSIFARGAARARASGIHRLLSRWLGPIDASICQHIAAIPNQDIVDAWLGEAIELNDVESAAKLLEKIVQTPVPPPEGSSEAR